VGNEVADGLRNNYTVLELETFNTEQGPVTAYCIVDQIPVVELPMLETHKDLHATFIREFNKGNYGNCEVIVQGLMGKFNGEMDSFYNIILDRIK
jgi:hypothetical protein